MSEKELFKTLSSEDEREKKTILYKFFFFNFLTSVNLPEVFKQKVGNPDFISSVVRALFLMLDSLRERD